MKHKIEDIKEAANMLGLLPYETAKSAEKKYKDLVRRLHPDLNPDNPEKANRETAALNRAYSIIKDFFEGYVYSFGKNELERYNPQDAELEKMRRDTTWGA